MIDNILKASRFYKKIIPIRTDGKGKTPAVKWKHDPKGEWPTADPKRLKQWWSKNSRHNVGAVVGDTWWVLDLDVSENGKKDGISRLQSLGFDIEALKSTTYWVSTPRGGVHLYFQWTDKCRFKTATDVLGKESGIDTRTPNQSYVRIWPTKGFEYHNQPSKMSEAPDELVKKLNDEIAAIRARNAKRSESPKYNEAQVERYLQNYDVRDYRSRDDWIKMMIKVNSASGGNEWGKELFTKWSLKDDYEFTEDPTEAIDREWETLDPEGELTGKTLESKHERLKLEKTMFTKIEEYDPEPLAVSIEWEIGKNDMLKRTDKNFMLLFTTPTDHDGMRNPFCDMLYYNELRSAIMYTKAPPWMPQETKKDDLVMHDSCIQELKIQLESCYNISYSYASLERLVEAVARRNKINPVTEYLDNIKWDGKPRVDSLFIKAFGAESKRYNKMIAAHMMISACARAHVAGCKVDTMTILEGPQGIGKSSFISILGGEFAKTPNFEGTNKDMAANMTGWLNEWQELMAFNQKDAQSIKEFVSNAVDTFRPAYGRRTVDFKRRSILIATMNPEGDGTYLRDSTGARRFNPIYLPKELDRKWLERNRDQLWAEANHRFTKGEKWFINNAEDQKIAQQEQSLRTTEDAWTGIVAGYIDQCMKDGTKCIDPMLVMETVIGKPSKDVKHHDLKRIGIMLKAAGFEAKKMYGKSAYSKSTLYYRKDSVPKRELPNRSTITLDDLE